MAKITAPSTQQEMTDAQIEKIVEKFRATLKKHQGKFTRREAQKALGSKDLVPELLKVFCYKAERSWATLTPWRLRRRRDVVVDHGWNDEVYP